MEAYVFAFVDHIIYLICAIKHGTAKRHFKQILGWYSMVSTETTEKTLEGWYLQYGICYIIKQMKLPKPIEERMFFLLEIRGVNRFHFYVDRPSIWFKGRGVTTYATHNRISSKIYEECIVPRMKLLEQIIKS